MDEEHDEELGDEDSDEHAERIDGGIGDAGGVALGGVVGIAECHGVCHGPAENATDGAPVVAPRVEGHESDDEHGHDGEGCTQCYPEQSFGTHDGLEEVASGIESEAGEIERKAELSEHERRRACGVADEVEPWP